MHYSPVMLVINFIGLFFLTLIFPSGVRGDDSSKYPDIRQIKPGIFKFGQIKINKTKREISFSAFCNQTSGLIEYALVNENGKVHESLFRTSIRPKLIHATLLLLEERPTPEFFKDLENDKKNMSKFNPIQIFSEWEHNGTRKIVEISKMVLNQTDGRQLAENSFVFTGSKMIEGFYLAEEDGSIVAVYHDTRATINCMDEHSDSDDVWVANHVHMPPKDFPVMIRFHLQRDP